MKQKALRTVAALISGAAKIRAGAAVHGESLGLVVGSKALMDADLEPLKLAVNAHLSAVIELRKRRTGMRNKVEAMDALLYAIRDSLKRSLGRQYSSEWAGTGFERSLQIPRSVADLLMLALHLKNFLTKHPEKGIEDVATAALAGVAHAELLAAHGAVTVQIGEVGTLLTARKRREKTLRLRMRGVAEELNRVIGPLDGRWESFGLNQPGIKQAPEAPKGVTVEPFNEVESQVNWERSPRAEYYRVWLKVRGVDLEPVAVGTPGDLDFMLEQLPPDSEGEVSVSAVNSGGESARSEVVVVKTKAAPSGDAGV